MKFFLMSFNHALTPSTGRQQELWNNPSWENVLGKIRFSILTLCLYYFRKPRARDGRRSFGIRISGQQEEASRKQGCASAACAHDAARCRGCVIKHLSVAPDFPFRKSFSDRINFGDCWVHVMEFSKAKKKSNDFIWSNALMTWFAATASARFM